MKQKLLASILLASLLAAGFAVLPAARPAFAECISGSGNGDVDAYFGPFDMPAGATITATMTTSIWETSSARAAAPGTPTAIVIIINGVYEMIDAEFTTPHTYTYTFTEDTSNVELLLDWLVNGDPANTYTVTSSGCENTFVAGCDTLVSIPSQAVMGLFTSNATVYWAPESGAATPLTISAGKTYRVTGQDATGQFRQIILECQFVWVPFNTVGPDPEPLWGSAPLPTTVVK
jgi:hypothetical protein